MAVRIRSDHAQRVFIGFLILVPVVLVRMDPGGSHQMAALPETVVDKKVEHLHDAKDAGSQHQTH